MKNNKFFRSAVSLVLAVALLLPVMPSAFAATYTCELCKKSCKYTELKEANCHEEGVVEYTCTNTDCDLRNKGILVKTPIDPKNHDTVCTDNGDGETHTATCRVCKDYRDISEAHTFENGYCTQCSAADYTKAELSMVSSIDIYVDLADTQAELSIGDIAVKVGNVDITDSYTLSYSWMDQYGKSVSNNETYLLPSSLTSKVGDYSFGCFVMAMPTDVSVGKFVSKSCTVTVHVRDLVTATATVSSDKPDFTLGGTNNHTEISIAEQIYQSAYDLTDFYPSYVVFGTHPESSVGILKEMGDRYYFDPANRNQESLDKVEFEPSGDVSGSFVINFTVYDTKGNDFPGVLTIVVEHSTETIDVAYFGNKGENIDLDTADFDVFWERTYSRGSLTFIYFEDLPTSKEGTLYFDYSSKSHSGVKVTTDDTFYASISSPAQDPIDEVTFVPYSKFTGYVMIPFSCYGLNNSGKHTVLSGNLTFFIGTDEVDVVTFTVDSEKTVQLDADDFMDVYQHATDRTARNFVIRLLDVPENGELYVDYTGNVRDKALTTQTISEHSFYFSNKLSSEISDLTYVAPKVTKAVTDTIRYAAYDSKGEFQFVGEIDISVKPTVVIYTKHFSDVVKSPATEWYYTAVMDLAEANVIGGFEDGTFQPNGEVTYGQALKLIMLAAGYPVPVQTGTHWASGYLSVAQASGLVSPAITESYLDRKIDRNTIAQIAAKALKLPASTITTSPFADVVVGTTYASYIFSLYEAGIITGSVDAKTGRTVYYGINSIRRSEMAVIVWRINNYKTENP